MDVFLSRLFSSEEQELYILDCMAYFMDFMAACTFVSLLFQNVPYGRYASSKYGFPVNVKFAWFVQELPSLLLPLCLVFWTSSSQTSLLPNQLLIAMFLCHYVQRTLIYPFLIRGGKATPFASFALAFVFCVYNGYMQVRYLSHYAEYPADWVTHPRFITGSALWLIGWLMNIHSDHILRNLRKPGEAGYKIPRGILTGVCTFQRAAVNVSSVADSLGSVSQNSILRGMFEYVSGANFLGEITEWAGFALAGHSAHSTAFSIFTTVVLANRAVAHHKWYLAKFEDYPKSRKALIPFLF